MSNFCAIVMLRSHCEVHILNFRIQLTDVPTNNASEIAFEIDNGSVKCKRQILLACLVVHFYCSELCLAKL